MSRALPLSDAPRPDVALDVDGLRPSTPGLLFAVVPAGGLEPALAFAEHVVRALRVGGLVPEAWYVDRPPRGRTTEVRDAGGKLASRLAEAGAEAVRAVDLEASDGPRLRELLLGRSESPLVVLGADAPLVVVPTLTLAVTLGRPVTTWSASVRASRPTWDAEVVEPRSELARGIVSAALKRRDGPPRRG